MLQFNRLARLPNPLILFSLSLFSGALATPGQLGILTDLDRN